jgi:predicted metal-binding membrane protein
MTVTEKRKETRFMKLMMSLLQEETPGRAVPVGINEMELIGGEHMLAIALLGPSPLSASLVVSLSKDEIMTLAAMLASIASDIEDDPDSLQA